MTGERKMVERSAWSARQYRDEDKAAVLRLSALQFGDKELAKEEYYDWLSGHTPAGRTIGVVIEDIRSNEIVGFNWNVPFYARLQGRDGICYLGCNQLVHPEFRGKGVFKAIHDLAFKSMGENLFKYGFPKPMAVGPLKSVGIFLVGRFPLLLRPLDITQLTKWRLGNPAVRIAAHRAWQIAGSTIWRPRLPHGRILGVEVFEDAVFDESFDDFWKRIADKYEIMAVRDSAFLNWRFCNLAFRSYRILSARVNGEVVGYVVLRCMDIEGVSTGLIVDFVVERSARGEEGGLLLLQEATRVFREAGVAVASVLMLSHTQEYSLLRRAGYIDCPERFTPKTFGLVAVPLSRSVSTETLARLDCWFMTLANHDAV